MKEITMPYDEYMSMIKQIKDLTNIIESESENMILVKSSVVNTLGGSIDYTYTRRKYSDIKGDVIRSLKTCREYESYEKTISDLKESNSILAREVSRLRNRTLLECIFG